MCLLVAGRIIYAEVLRLLVVFGPQFQISDKSSMTSETDDLKHLLRAVVAALHAIDDQIDRSATRILAGLTEIDKSIGYIDLECSPR